MATPNITTGLTFGPSFPVGVKRNYQTKSVRFKTGHRVGWSLGVTLRTFMLQYRNLDDTEFDALIAFLAARGGGRVQFYFDLIQTGEVDIPVHLVNHIADESFTTPRTRDVAVRLDEVVV